MTIHGFLNALTLEELREVYSDYRGLLGEMEQWWQNRTVKDEGLKADTREWYILAMDCVMTDKDSVRASVDRAADETRKKYNRDRDFIIRWEEKLPPRDMWSLDKYIERRGRRYFVIGIMDMRLQNTAYSSYDLASEAVEKYLSENSKG